MQFTSTTKTRIFFTFISALVLGPLFLSSRPPIITHDTFDYILGRSIRGWIYPLFIDAVIPAQIQESPFLSKLSDSIVSDLPKAPVPVQKSILDLVKAQQALAFLSVILLFWVLASNWTYYPPLILGAYALASALPGSLTTLLLSGPSILLSEGLLVPYLALLICLIFHSVSKKSVGSLFLGILCGLVLMLNPRLLPFAIFSFAPLLSEPMKRLRKTSLLSPLACAATVTLLCLSTLYQYKVFSPLPFNGFSAFGVALEFARKDTVQSLSSTQERDFVSRCMDDPRYNPDPTIPLFVNRNVWEIGSGHFNAVYGPAHMSSINKVLADVSRQLLFEDKDARAAWISWIGRETRNYLATYGGINLLFGLIFLAGAVCTLTGRSTPSSALALLLPLVHGANILFTISFQGFLPRYAETTETLLPLGLCFALVGMKEMNWKKGGALTREN